MINLIAVVGKNNELGKDNALLWNLPNDLKFFKEQTLNKTVLMGRKTYESLGRPLPKRINLVISSSNIEGVKVLSIEEALEYSLKNDIFVIGGQQVYKTFLPHADNIYLTEVPLSAEADVYFPQFEKSLFDKQILGNNEDNGIEYIHALYKRK